MNYFTNDVISNSEAVYDSLENLGYFDIDISKMEDYTLPSVNILSYIPSVHIKYLDGAHHLSKRDNGDWIDLYTYEDVALKKEDYKLISLGVAMHLPDGYEAYIVPRSSTFKDWGVIQTNHHAIIDHSYCGNEDIWKYPVYATRDVFIPKDTRLCQFRIQQHQPRFNFVEVDELNFKSRGGFGTSGK